ncbi:hypothetical protein SUGI_1053230 [Cryptomeria japonica]|nr:hypothetical protein SUGI_1053230 [Cryptomeria japonica]
MAIDEANTDDGFQTINKKRRRKGNNINCPKTSNPASSGNLLPQTPLVIPPVVESSSANPPCSPAICSNNSDLNISLGASQKFPQKVFKELSDDCSIEIIPAINNLLGMPSMEVDSQSENEDDPKSDTLASKRRGKPLGSKNKTSGKKTGDSSTKSLPSADEVGVVCPTPSNVSS